MRVNLAVPVSAGAWTHVATSSEDGTVESPEVSARVRSVHDELEPIHLEPSGPIRSQELYEAMNTTLTRLRAVNA